ncbi:type I-E CRISPR-associated protein Cas6/Cse3/CasE [Micrococcus flavus]|uniref:type I-E CRISPR-associated protein Cas6/Cse3/CasE n=1 Tax=Micrococcus flavus TaxID=384602 RepID=UPI001072B36B|nr:type I-E CRISPR-associated protein Cas6/Cse3/CasE [Micrococcus flavus]TFI00786.1 type I-E CRISPR-associated protein Cas6/Cse3/CasE [Micrococcus flavus]
MTVLARMSLNAATRGGRRLLGDRQAMHAAVMSAFSPGAHDAMAGRVLWRAFLSRLVTGQRWAFRLAANPVKAKAQPDGRRSKVLPHVTPAQQVAWLQERAAGWGFSVPAAGESDGPGAVTVTHRADERFGRGQNGAGRRRSRVTLRVVQFDGVLDVADASLLRQALTGGMGRAKGYGCGLMTLRPIAR